MAQIVTHKNDEPMFGSSPLIKHAREHTFPAIMYEMFSGKRPNQNELELFDLILNLSIDHGEDTPSAKATVISAKAGSSMGGAVGDGVKMINEKHGGATEPAMHMFYAMGKNKSLAKNIVNDCLCEKKRIPGFGHRLYEEDPRAELILETIERLKFPNTYCNFARALEVELAKSVPDKTLPLNIDGAIAVALCTFQWEPRASTAVFIAARAAGLCAHYLNTTQESGE